MLDKKGQSTTLQLSILVLVLISLIISGFSLSQTMGQGNIDEIKDLQKGQEELLEKIRKTRAQPTENKVEVLRIAALLPGDVTDRSWNQSVYESLMRMDSKEEYTIKITSGVYRAANATTHLRAFAEAGYDLVIAHGFQYHKVGIQVARDYPDTYFLVNAGLFPEKPLPNLAVGDVRTDQQGFLEGIVMAEMSESSQGGYISGSEVAELARCDKGFQAAIDNLYPDFNYHPVYTGDFHDIGLAEGAVSSLVEDYNVDVVAPVGDGVSRGAMKRAAEENIWSLGSSTDWGIPYPDSCLVSGVWRWDVLFERVANDIRQDEFKTNTKYWLSFETEGISLSSFNSAVPSSVRDKVAKYAQKIRDGELLAEPLS